MKYTRFALGLMLAALVSVMTACVHSAMEETATTVAQSEIRTVVTEAGGSSPVPETFSIETVHFCGDGYNRAELRAYLDFHREAKIDAMHGHGISESEALEISAVPLYSIDLRTGTVNLNFCYLPIMEEGAMICAAAATVSDTLSVSVNTAHLSWMSVVDRYLRNNPDERYLLAEYYTDNGNYVCLISSRNEIVYLVRPESGENLPFEDGIDYFGKLYDNRLVISYDKVYAEKRPIRSLMICYPSGHISFCTSSQRVYAEFSGKYLNRNDPLATEGVTVTGTSFTPVSEFESLCETMRSVRVALFPSAAQGVVENTLAVKNGKYTLILYYEDGTVFATQFEHESVQEQALLARLAKFFSRF